MNNRILIADDDVELCSLLQEYLTQQDFDVSFVHDGSSAIKELRAHPFDLLILDVMMPLKNGFDTLAEVRQTLSIPVIMLTARGEKIDRIVGLEMGADDYVAKPCDPRELVARIRAVTRRAASTNTQSSEENSGKTIEIDKLLLDPLSRRVTIDNTEIEFTSTEFEILHLLMLHAGRLVTKDEISQTCLGKRLQAFDRSIDMHLSNLRKKIGQFDTNKPRIKTIRGNGYQYLIWSKR